MKSILKKVGMLAMIAALTFSICACSTSTSTDADDSTTTDTDSTTADTDSTATDACTLNLTFLDTDGNAITDYTADVTIEDVDEGTYTADDSGMITINDVNYEDCVTVTVYDADGNTLATSDLYVFSADTSMYSNNTSGVLYLYAEDGTSGLTAQMQITDNQSFECVDLT